MDNNQINFNPTTGQPIQNGTNTMNMQPQYQQMPNYNQQPQKKTSPLKIILMVIGGIAVLTIVLICIIFFGAFGTSNKLVCKSNEGNITIMYTKKQITGYTAKGISYDLDGQKEVAKQIGVETYINQFETWFSTNTTGTCERK